MPVFDYSALLPADAARLKALAAEAAHTDTRLPRGAVAAGVALTEAKRLVGRGRFLEWCAAELRWSRETVAVLMRVAKAFSTIPISELLKFDSSALYVLSAKRCPPEARRQAIREATRGESITYSRARELRDAAAPPVRHRRVPPTPKLDSERDGADLPELTLQHRSWLELEALFARCTMIHLSRETDEEEGEGILCGRAYFDDGPDGEPIAPRHACRKSLAYLVGQLAGNEKRKVCGHCKADKSLDEFSANSSEADGRNRRCLVCERKRLAKRTKDAFLSRHPHPQ